MAINYTDPQSSINWLLQPNVGNQEADTNAASGLMPGSGFQNNNRLRLRTSERANYFKLGQDLLQPYLNRASTEGIEARRIAADAARQAISEAGADRRLSSENQQRLQLALINGNQQAAHDLLSEAGLDRRQSAQITSHFQDTILNNQQRTFEALLPYEQRNLEARRATLPRYASQQNPVVLNGGAYSNGYSPVTASGGSTLHPPPQNTSSADQSAAAQWLARLRGGTGGGVAPAPNDPYANWRDSLPTPIPGGANWTPERGAPWAGTPTYDAAVNDWKAGGRQPFQFDWEYAQDPEMEAAQNYYE